MCLFLERRGAKWLVNTWSQQSCSIGRIRVRRRRNETVAAARGQQMDLTPTPHRIKTDKRLMLKLFFVLFTCVFVVFLLQLDTGLLNNKHHELRALALKYGHIANLLSVSLSLHVCSQASWCICTRRLVLYFVNVATFYCVAHFLKISVNTRVSKIVFNSYLTKRQSSFAPFYHISALEHFYFISTSTPPCNKWRKPGKTYCSKWTQSSQSSLKKSRWNDGLRTVSSLN